MRCWSSKPQLVWRGMRRVGWFCTQTIRRPGFITLSQAAATYFTGPMIITLMAALVMGEPIGPRRIVAVVGRPVRPISIV